MKEKLLDKDTIDAYHSYVQSQIRSDLNSVCLGPGKLPSRIAIGLTAFGFCCFLVGILLVALRMQHVYFWDWEVQFVGPFFFILFLMCLAGASYLMVVATRRSNRYRRELYFRPLGDYGIAAVHKDDLLHEHEMKHDLKSGTTPHKSVMPRSEAYSQMNVHKQKRSGHNNQGYRHGPGDPHRRPPGPGDPHRRPPGPSDPHRRPPPDDRRRGPPPDGRRGPPPDDRRRPPDDRRGPPEGRRGPPRDGEYRRGPPPPDDRRRPPDDRRGPPDDRRGPPDDRRRPPDDRRGPPPGGRRSPPPGGPRDDDRRGPPPPGGRRSPPPEGFRGPPPGGYRDDRRGPPRGSPPDDRRRPPPDDRRGPPRGVPTFRERSPDEGGKVRLDDNRESESEL